MNANFKTLSWLIVTTAIIGVLCCSCKEAASWANRRNCKQQLRSLGVAIMLYRQGHTNSFPPNLETLVKEMDISSVLLTCPGAKANGIQNGGKKDDYFYIDWSKLSQASETASDKYPLMYDCRLANHNGQGINILMTDGSTKWDSHAEWLKKFAAEHPNYKIPIPK